MVYLLKDLILKSILISMNVMILSDYSKNKIQSQTWKKEQNLKKCRDLKFKK